MIITIARECGSNGHEIGEQLAADLGIALYDKEALIEEAKRQKIYDKLKRFFEEEPMDSLLYSIVMNSGLEHFEETAFAFLHSLAEKQSMVLIGRCSNFILKDCKDVTSVFIHGDMPDKINRVMRVKNLSEKKAEEYINLVDEKRMNFHKRYTKERWGDARNYDLCINGSRISSAQAAEMILQFRKMKQ